MADGVFSGIYNPFIFNQYYYYDLLPKADYSDNVFWRPFHQQIVDYNDKYMIFVFHNNSLTNRQNETVALNPENYIKEILYYDQNKTDYILNRYQNGTNFSYNDLTLY